jgi:elongation factor Ts
MEIPASLVKTLREKTGIGIMDCKSALIEAKGNLEEAVKILRKKGLAKAEEKASRIAKEGLVGSYVHIGGKIGVLVEVNCETDFVARNEDFQHLVKDIAMHIAATDPKYMRREEIPEDVIQQERDIYRCQLQNSNKPPQVIEKIVDGKMEKFYSEVCLVEQPFVKDQSITIEELISSNVVKMGEKIAISRFIRFKLGEDTKAK